MCDSIIQGASLLRCERITIVESYTSTGSPVYSEAGDTDVVPVAAALAYSAMMSLHSSLHPNCFFVHYFASELPLHLVLVEGRFCSDFLEQFRSIMHRL